MSIIKWAPFLEPFEEMEKFMSDASSRNYAPAVDVYETADSVIIESPLAGVDPNNVEVSIENDTLSIKGQFKKESEVDDKNYYRKEISSGSFYRSVALPSKVEKDKAVAESKDGLLKITIPKAPESKPTSIKISVTK
ncbi:MAG: Hsp20/alpha crystallin family protein [Patescibacteria group bacterium]|nr:Hsp20/alpha crystallin family protein [Patescibacteria group bacterium]